MTGGEAVERLESEDGRGQDPRGVCEGSEYRPSRRQLPESESLTAARNRCSSGCMRRP
jgi:hypothetical protein